MRGSLSLPFLSIMGNGHMRIERARGERLRGGEASDSRIKINNKKKKNSNNNAILKIKSNCNTGFQNRLDFPR